MVKTFRRIVFICVMFIVLSLIASAIVVAGGCSSKAGDPLEGTRNGMLNAALDASGIKGRVDAELREKAGDIAEEMGIPQSTVDNFVDQLAIEDWQVTSLPAGATETGTHSVNAQGTTAQITTYDDPSIVTIDAYGQSLTMEVPESAQEYTPLLKYLGDI